MSEPAQPSAGSDGPLLGGATVAPTAPVRRAGNSILCPACERLNGLDRERCDRCGENLFIDCQRCGVRNPRVNTRCSKCRQRFSQVRRARSGSWRLSPIFWIAIVSGIGLILGLILLVWLGGGKLPSL